MKPKLLSLAFLLLLTTQARADVRVVAPSGAPYAEIQAAIDVAVDGDVILVRTGTYQSFVARNIDMAIVADAGAIVNVAGAIRVSGLSATRALVLSGLRATGNSTTNPSSRHGLIARNCVGSIRVVGCLLTGVPLNLAGSQHCTEGQGALVENCADVAFVGCTLQGSTAPGQPGYPASPGLNTVPNANESDGGHGTYATVSKLAVYDCTLTGGRAGYHNFTFYGTCEPPPYATTTGYIAAAGEGFRGSGTFIFASNCTFTGANGWDTGCLGPCFCSCAGNGGNAFVHDTGSTMGFLLACSTLAGNGGVNRNYCGCLTTGPCAAQCCGGGFPPPFSCSAPSGVTINGTPTMLAGSARRLVVPRIAREQGQITLDFLGVSGDRVVIRITDSAGFTFLPAARGVQLTRRTHPQLAMELGTIGPSGSMNQTWTMPDLGSGLQGKVFHLQASFVSTSGQTTLSSPGVLVLLDAAF